MEVLNHGLFISATWPVHKSISSFVGGKRIGIQPSKKKKTKNTGKQGCDTFGKVQPLNENVITRQTL